MNQYQLTLLIKNDLEEKARGELIDSIKTMVNGKSEKEDSAPNSAEAATKGEKASTIKEDLWGTRSLSYPIKHQDRAFYAHFEFEAEPSSIASLDKSCKLNEDIIRYLLIRK